MQWQYVEHEHQLNVHCKVQICGMDVSLALHIMNSRKKILNIINIFAVFNLFENIK